MNFTKEYDEVMKNFAPAMVDEEFAKIYYAHPKNLVNYINKFVIPAFYHLSQDKSTFSDFCNIHIKIFKAQIDLNRDLFIQYSDEIIDTIVKMQDILHLSAEINPKKKDELIDSLACIIRNLYLYDNENIKNLIILYTSLGGNLKDLNIISIDAECDADANKIYLAVRNPDYKFM